MKTYFTFFIFLILGICFYSCSDSTGSVSEKTGKDLIGEWRWVKTTGGIYAAYIGTPSSEGYNLYYTFFDSTVISDRIYSTHRTIDTLNYSYKKAFSYIVNDSMMFLLINNKVREGYGIRGTVEFKADTLILDDDCVDGQAHWYVRAK